MKRSPTSCVAAPPESIIGQVVLIDRPRSETKAVKKTEKVVKRALRGASMQPYPEIKPCPDHRSQGEIVQVADMFAGALHAQGHEGHYLRRLGRMFVVI